MNEDSPIAPEKSHMFFVAVIFFFVGCFLGNLSRQEQLEKEAEDWRTESINMGMRNNRLHGFLDQVLESYTECVQSISEHPGCSVPGDGKLPERPETLYPDGPKDQ